MHTFSKKRLDILTAYDECECFFLDKKINELLLPNLRIVMNTILRLYSEVSEDNVKNYLLSEFRKRYLRFKKLHKPISYMPIRIRYLLFNFFPEIDKSFVKLIDSIRR